MGYDRVVAAALAETSSKFKLAEALALDIPAHRPGPIDADGRTVGDYLLEAREAIKAAGGEPRAVITLDKYRRTALWVSTDVGRDFAWVPGVSFSAHNEARERGLEYADFAANPRTVDQIRREMGAPGTDGQPSNIARGWSPEQRVEAAREILSDPDVADQVMNDREARNQAMDAVDRVHERENLHRPRPEPVDDTDRSTGAYQQEMTLVFARLGTARRVLNEVAEVLNTSPFIHSEPEYQDGVRGMVTGLSNRLDMITGITDGKDMDDALADLLSGGEAA